MLWSCHLIVGTVVKSNSHVSYLCRIYGRLEAAQAPEPEAYAFGAFMAIAPTEGSPTRLIGVIRDTLLINPDFGATGPRLSPDRDLAVFSPDYLNEKGVLVDVLILGWEHDGLSAHGVPSVAAQIGSRVQTLTDDEIVQFHTSIQEKFVVGYLPQLLSRNDPMVAGLLLRVLDRLEPHFPRQQQMIGVLKNNLAWKARVVPAG